MIPILLLDCSDELLKSLKNKGYDVEAGSVGFQTGVRHLPSQIYEKRIFIYNPTSLGQKMDMKFKKTRSWIPHLSLS
jgi:hypothetical protein